MHLPEGYFLQDKKYQLTHIIGQGGFGITYFGLWDTVVKGGLGTMKTKVPVCIKEYFFKDYCYRDKATQSVRIHSSTGEKIFDKFKEKLIKEANILSAVHHPHIVSVLEVFEENNTAYIVMEYITGCSLKYMLDKEGVIAESRALKYAHQIGAALAFAHEKNIVHLDIKPSNILIDRDDNARLIDFGVSKRYDIEEQETSTTTLTLSKGFASIEQYDNEGTQNFSPCPDVYSLGATMYNILTGVIPVESILRATKQLPAPSSYNSNVTKKTEQAILKAMAVKPEDRFQTMKEMLATLDVPNYESAVNTLTETQWTDDNFTNTLHNTRPVARASDDDQTIVAPLLPADVADDNGARKQKNKNTKRRIFALAAALLCLGAWYVLSAYWLDKPAIENTFSGIDSFNDVNRPFLQQEETDVNAQKQLNVAPDSVAGKTDTVSRATTSVNNAQSQVQQTTTVDKQEKTTPAQNANQTPTSRQLDPDEKLVDSSEDEYRNYMASGSDKMNSKNFVAALYDFRAAAKKKSTSEVADNIKHCIDELYDDGTKSVSGTGFGTFGNLTLVKDRKTGLFGAINSDGEEVILCKYTTFDFDQHDNSPIFQRSDRRYDIYNNKGELIYENRKL